MKNIPIHCCVFYSSLFKSPHTCELYVYQQEMDLLLTNSLSWDCIVPGKVSFPSWLQVFIDALPFVFVPPEHRAQRCASGEHIWVMCERVDEAGARGGGHSKTKDPLESGNKPWWASCPGKCQRRTSCDAWSCFSLSTWFLVVKEVNQINLIF